MMKADDEDSGKVAGVKRKAEAVGGELPHVSGYRLRTVGASGVLDALARACRHEPALLQRSFILTGREECEDEDIRASFQVRLGAVGVTAASIDDAYRERAEHAPPARRRGRRMLGALVSRAIAEARDVVAELAAGDGTQPQVQLVRNAHNEREVDGSFVVYEQGGHFAVHNDAAGERKSNRRYTALVTLLPSKEHTGETEFPTFDHRGPRAFAGSAGSVLAWRNVGAGGFPDARAAHRALPASAAASASPLAFRSAHADGGYVRACKVVVNVWFR